ncbi:MAG TPA: NAD+ synthase [Elusimicrobia bacterium]|nr:MAG: NAD+ synthase [Elusimicrobia bacterium RIFOXYD2_FULL_34_30]HAM38214.1 NAD+ synthase [Elusimicrobiota bacterium]
MNNTLRIALAQINCTVGDLNGNYNKVIEYISKADNSGADIVAFPELTITGYPPEDLLLKPKFISDNLEIINKLSKKIKKIVAIVGFVNKQKNNLFNSAAIIYDGKIKGIYNKMILPNYGVFDEKRYFHQGDNPIVFKYGKYIFGVGICEDIWNENTPIKKQVQLGADIIFNINASPYYAGKIKLRESIIQKQAKSNNIRVVYVNLVGGQDELVFDGQSMIIDNNGKFLGKSLAFNEDLFITDINIPLKKIKKNQKIINITNQIPIKSKIKLPEKNIKPLKPIEEIYNALLLGLSDYVRKNGFKKVVIGLSGGIDSALVAALAVDSLGKENVTGVFMPSQYSSTESGEDAKQLAYNLGIRFSTIPINQIYKTYLYVLKQTFKGHKQDITEENLQARIRGNLLMALSNKFGCMVLTTGNKSEMSAGYATLYGDMAGGFAVIKDVPKILVYKLSEYRNSLYKVIPKRILTKAPTAELRPNQKDSDTLPKYEILDPILKAYIEDDMDMEQIVLMGYEKNVVTKIISMVDRSEYKRRQSPPGIKITYKAFGKDRRMPITNGYR